MIAKQRLEWTIGSGGARSAKTGKGLGSGKRLLAFSKLSSHEGISLGAPHFVGGEVSFYELDELVEAIEAKESSLFEDAFLLYEAEKLSEGAECIAQGCCLPLLVSYEVDYAPSGEEALITPVLRICSLRTATVCASLKVDGYELLPSARVPLSAGLNVEKLRPVKLVRPKKYWSKTGSEATVYRMELELSDGSPKPVQDVRELSVWGVKA